MKTELIINDTLKEEEILIHAKTTTIGARVLSYIDYFTTDKENFIIQTSDEIFMIQKNEIVCAEIHDKTLIIYTTRKEYTLSKSLTSLMKELNSGTFLQVSKSEILNIQMLDRVEPSFSGNLIACMKNEKRVNVSRRFVPKLKERLGI